jgi:hypothetical protein
MQNIPLPYGDAYLVGTPAIDRMSQQLYAEQKQRELIRQKQGAALDEEFAKNVANVRDVDVPEITKRYGEWKTANQQLIYCVKRQRYTKPLMLLNKGWKKRKK